MNSLKFKKLMLITLTTVAVGFSAAVPASAAPTVATGTSYSKSASITKVSDAAAPKAVKKGTHKGKKHHKKTAKAKKTT